MCMCACVHLYSCTFELHVCEIHASQLKSICSTLDEGQVSDVLQCISAQMSSPQGRLQLVKCGVLEALGQSYVLGRPGEYT